MLSRAGSGVAMAHKTVRRMQVARFALASVAACEAAGADQDPGGGCSGILATSRPPGTPLGFAAAAALAVAAALARSRPRRA